MKKTAIKKLNRTQLEILLREHLELQQKTNMLLDRLLNSVDELNKIHEKYTLDFIVSNITPFKSLLDNHFAMIYNDYYYEHVQLVHYAPPYELPDFKKKSFVHNTLDYLDYLQIEIMRHVFFNFNIFDNVDLRKFTKFTTLFIEDIKINLNWLGHINKI